MLESSAAPACSATADLTVTSPCCAVAATPGCTLKWSLSLAWTSRFESYAISSSTTSSALSVASVESGNSKSRVWPGRIGSLTSTRDFSSVTPSPVALRSSTVAYCVGPAPVFLPKTTSVYISTRWTRPSPLPSSTSCQLYANTGRGAASTFTSSGTTCAVALRASWTSRPSRSTRSTASVGTLSFAVNVLVSPGPTLPTGSSTSVNMPSSACTRGSTRYAAPVPVFLTVAVSAISSPALTVGGVVTETSRFAASPATGADQSTPIFASASTSFFSWSAWTLSPSFLAPATSLPRLLACTLDARSRAKSISKSSWKSSSASLASSSSSGGAVALSASGVFLRSTRHGTSYAGLSPSFAYDDTRCASRSFSPYVCVGGSRRMKSCGESFFSGTYMRWSWMSGTMPRFWMLRSPGVRYCAIVSLSLEWSSLS